MNPGNGFLTGATVWECLKEFGTEDIEWEIPWTSEKGCCVPFFLVYDWGEKCQQEIYDRR